MIDTIKGAVRKVIGWMNNRVGRMVAAAAAVVVLAGASFMMGGIVAQAALITLSVYVGTMITVSRMRKPPPEDSSKLWKIVHKPIQIFSKFMFKHRLMTTVALGLLATSLIGVSTVTGVAVAALSAIAGDPLVSAFADFTDWLDEIHADTNKEPAEKIITLPSAA